MYYAVRVFVALVLLFLIAPILAVMPLSFNSESFFTYPMPGFSLKWYEDFFFNPRWSGAVKMSFLVAIATTILATTLGTLAALGLARAKVCRPQVLRDDMLAAWAAARSSSAMFSFRIVSMASIVRRARSPSGSPSNSCSRVGTTCHDRPQRSVSQPHCPSAPPSASASHSRSTSA